MSDLSGALCVGKGPLFESTHPTDHAEASQLCGAGTADECPAFAACGGMARGLQRGPVTDRPVGTWAGVLYGTDGRNPREHGTERGYQQHRHNREKKCEPCLRAHNQKWLKAQVNPPNRTPVRVESGTRRGPVRANGTDPLTTDSILETNGG